MLFDHSFSRGSGLTWSCSPKLDFALLVSLCHRELGSKAQPPVSPWGSLLCCWHNARVHSSVLGRQRIEVRTPHVCPYICLLPNSLGKTSWVIIPLRKPERHLWAQSIAKSPTQRRAWRKGVKPSTQTPSPPWWPEPHESRALEFSSPPQPLTPTLKDYKYNRLWQITPWSSALNAIW